MRMRNKPWAEVELRQNPKVIFGPDAHDDPSGQWHQIFGNTNPIHLEIGAGKGDFIIALAKRYPDINFVAAEKVEEVLIFPARYAVEHQTPNLFCIYGEASFLDEYFAPGEVERIYLNFSDPWRKYKHRKRRLTHPNFLELYKTILKPGGQIYFKTDNLELFEYSTEQLIENGFIIQDVTNDLHNSEYAADNIMTGYEARWTKVGKKINRLVAVWPGEE